MHNQITRQLLVLGVLMSSLGAAAEVLHEWSFSDPAFELVGQFGCETEVKDGVLRGRVLEGVPGVWMLLPAIDVPAPVKVRMRVRTDESTFGRGELYWTTDRRPNMSMSDFVRFPIEHDGEWHEYQVPLPSVGRFTQLRFAVGWKPGGFEVDWIRLEANPHPADVQKAIQSLPESVLIQDETLKVELKPHAHVYAITDLRTGRTWRGDASAGKAVLIEAKKRSLTCLELRLYDAFSESVYMCNVSLDRPGVLSFLLEADDRELPFYGLNEYPPMLKTNTEAGKLVFCDRSAGVFADQDDPVYGGMALAVYGNVQCTDMPLMGLVDTARGDGVMALVETPSDALFNVAPDGTGKHWPQIHWEESMDTFRYPRRLSYRFIAEGGYIALAKLYRDYAAEEGHVVPLRQKALRKPNVNLLPGAPIIWGAIDAVEFVKEASTEGLRRGVLCNAHHCLREENSLRGINEMGFITAPYDSFGDALDGPTGFNSDSIEETAVHLRPGLGPAQGWVDELHTYFTRSSAFAQRALDAYVLDSMERFGFNGRFIDVSMAMFPMEDWHPEHTFDKRQDLAYRRASFQWLDSLGLVLGIEHGNDWGVEFIEWTEGALGGPFWWRQTDPEGWKIMSRVKDREGYDPAYAKYSLRHDTRIPFWQLVYHDCTVSTWYWGDGPGWHYRAAPDVAGQKDLYQLLYGGVPVLWRGPEGYGWDELRSRFMQSYFDSCLFHEEVAFARMTNHMFLTEDMDVQCTQFDSGHTAVVNFGSTPRAFTTQAGDEVVLAPQGFWVEGPGFVQSRLMTAAGPVKHIEKDGFLLYEATQPVRIDDMRLDGRFVAFRISENRWQLALEPGKEFTFRVADLTGWHVQEPYALELLDEHGNARAVVKTGSCGDGVDIASSEDERFFALVLGPDAARIVAYPSGDRLMASEKVELTCAAHDVDIRYTLDGAEPSAESPLYDGPLTLNRSGPLKARVFVNRAPVGPLCTHNYELAQTLFASGIIEGGDEPAMLDVSLQGFERLRLFVGSAGDYCWSDWANWAGAAFVDADGAKNYLSDLEPLSFKQLYEDLGLDGNPRDRTPISINGEIYEKGLACFSESELVYAIPQGAVRFVAVAGVDDRSNPAPGEPEILRGSVTFDVEGVYGWGVNGRPEYVEIIPVVVEEPIKPRADLAGDEGQELSQIAFDMRTSWMDGPVRLRIPEVLVSSMGTHFIDHKLGGGKGLVPLHYLAEYPEWKQDPRTGALWYNLITREGVEFGCSAYPGEDEVLLMFHVTNRTSEPISWARGDMCLNLGHAPCLDHKWELDKLFVVIDGKLQPMSATSPTPEDMGTKWPWLNFLSNTGLIRYPGPRENGGSWFVDQPAGEENLMAAVSADGGRLIGYTWDMQPDVLMSNCGNPCLHTGCAASPEIGSGCTYTWHGKIYFVENDRAALLERVRADRAQGFHSPRR